MKHSESIKEISQAIVKAQAELKNIAQTAENPFYKSSYAPLNKILDDIKPTLAKHNLAVLQDIGELPNGKQSISTILLHSSGEWIAQDGVGLTLEKNTPQGAGSAITYGRRYSLCAWLNISSEEDDDGNGGESKVNKHFSEQPNIDRMKTLPQDIKEAFAALGYRSKPLQAFQLCEDLSWNEENIRARLNSLANEGK